MSNKSLEEHTPNNITMQKILYIVRHATAEDLGNSPMLQDFGRELTSRGIIEAARIAKTLAEQKHIPALIISSEAHRAKDTAKIFAEQLGYDAENIVLDATLYGGGARAYLACVNALPEDQSRVMIVGHNPDISFFVEYLCRENCLMDTATVCVVTLENLTWAEVSGKMGKLKVYLSKN